MLPAAVIDYSRIKAGVSADNPRRYGSESGIDGATSDPGRRGEHPSDETFQWEEGSEINVGKSTITSPRSCLSLGKVQKEGCRVLCRGSERS